MSLLHSISFQECLVFTLVHRYRPHYKDEKTPYKTEKTDLCLTESSKAISMTTMEGGDNSIEMRIMR